MRAPTFSSWRRSYDGSDYGSWGSADERRCGLRQLDHGAPTRTRAQRQSSHLQKRDERWPSLKSAVALATGVATGQFGCRATCHFVPEGVVLTGGSSAARVGPRSYYTLTACRCRDGAGTRPSPSYLVPALRSLQRNWIPARATFGPLPPRLRARPTPRVICPAENKFHAAYVAGHDRIVRSLRCFDRRHRRRITG